MATDEDYQLQAMRWAVGGLIGIKNLIAQYRKEGLPVSETVLTELREHLDGLEQEFNELQHAIK